MRAALCALVESCVEGLCLRAAVERFLDCAALCSVESCILCVSAAARFERAFVIYGEGLADAV